MQLSELIKCGTSFAFPRSKPSYLPQTEITGITEDSRQVKPGYLFAAITGQQFDGNEFIPDAIEKGAAAILMEPSTHYPEDVSILPHENPRKALGHIAARFYDAQPDTIVAVTGTNGKTSVAHFCRQLWNKCGLQSASLGTMGLHVGNKHVPLNASVSMTSPDTVFFHKKLAALKNADINHLAIEASSHGLDQSRMAGAHIKAAGFTSFSRDHLDYHKTIENYFRAKQKLFSELLSADGTAVLNADIDEYGELKQICEDRNIRVMSYGRKGKDIWLQNLTPTSKGQEINFTIETQEYHAVIPLIGEFQVSNILCAVGLLIATGTPANQACNVIDTLKAVSGRMEMVGHHASGAPVVVDYAHTPDALEKALEAARPHCGAQLYLIFGCGGDRDKGKRPEMGEVAERLADEVIITDDNPRTEDAATIRKEIMATCPKAKEIGGRREAITQTISQLKAGDLLLIAGKGHEDYQIIGEEKHHFSDKEVAQEALAT